MVIVKENFFKKIVNKIKNFFKTNNKFNNEKNITEKEKLDINYLPNQNYKRNEFLESIKINENTNIMNLKIKLENNEIKAIDLSDEEIDELQKIYDEEISKKEEKIKNLEKYEYKI